MGRAEAGVERVVRRAAVARLGVDLGVSAEDSTHMCACRVPLCSHAAAVMHGVVETCRSAMCMLLGHLQHCSYNRLGSAAATLLGSVH